jgi:outer membrane protein assembly factor BamB
VPHESHYIDSSWASASPVSDGEVLLAQFGSNGLFAYDLDGNELWRVDLGDMRTRNGFGEGSSPAIFGDTVVVNWDHEDDSFIVALDRMTGEELWRTARPDEVSSWATPLVVAPDEHYRGKAQVIVPGTGKSRGYDLVTGKEIWRLGGMTVNAIPTPVYKDGTVYLMSGYAGQMLQAVDLTKAQGELEGTEAVRFVHTRHTPYVPSPLLYGSRLYFLKHFKNILTVLDADTGAVVYTEKRLPGISNVYASPVGADGRVYFLSRDGHAVVLADGDTFEVLAENDLDDGFDASPALAGDTLYLRGRHHLYALTTMTEPSMVEPSIDDRAPSEMPTDEAGSPGE